MELRAPTRRQRITRSGWLLLAALIPAAPALGQSPAPEQDLETTLSLLGQPCGKVTAVTTQGNDHLVTCSNGARYRVFINAQGRVVAEKR
ncbi:MAG: hypothetical protein ACK59Y_01350 [Betaproteobacteria bacterium]|nr:hypothetical protein [Betaproteobacteria bacterium]